jgi:hypothetical protein
MPTNTYTPLATVTLASTDSEVIFGSIPSTYRDVIFVFRGQLSTATTLRMQINSDTGSNYSQVNMRGTGSGSGASGSGTFAFAYLGYVGVNGNEDFSVTGSLLDYSASDKHKTILFRMDDSAVVTEANAVRWASNTPINTIKFYTASGSMNIGTTISLYGVIA